MAEKQYLCIDLKSFYASVECVERGLDPFAANLVVADQERSIGTICLAVTPAMKALGIKNRCRLNEIPKAVSYIVAEPRMQLYIDYAARIYGVYLEYISKEDIHVYSIDEAFFDVTDYLSLYGMTAAKLGAQMMKAVFERTGVRAACGIGTNLYLAKVALDIMAKHTKTLIAELNEADYRRKLWKHKPLTDFWRVGAGTMEKLKRYGIYTMGDIAMAEETLLYQLFGIDAELLIDHAWGRETATIADIKKYRPKENSITSGQVLLRDYSFAEGRLIVKEMTDLLCLELVDKKLLTNSVTLQVGYSHSTEASPVRGTAALGVETNADKRMIPAVLEVYDRIVNPQMPIRRIHITCNRVVAEEYRQYSFLDDREELERNRKMQEVMLDIKKRFGKNAILKGMNLEKGATTRERNRQIGGHKSGSSNGCI